MDNLSEPPHLPVGRLLFIKPESLFIEKLLIIFQAGEIP
jgi:hypothetical protein